MITDREGDDDGQLWIVRCTQTVSTQASHKEPTLHVATFSGRSPHVQVVMQSEHPLPYVTGEEYILELWSDEVH